MARLTFGISGLAKATRSRLLLERAIAALPALIDTAIAAHADRISAFAESHKREPVIYTMGAGSNYATAYSHADLHLQEMQ